jgi:hypothetical protein
MTKVEAIKRVLEEFNGVATWEQIYNNIEKYYPSAKVSISWKEGIRGVLYREIKKGKNFKRIGLGIYALRDYEEEPKPSIKEKIRMHSYMEGVCLEIGKFKGFHVYTPDKTTLFKDRISLSMISTLNDIPLFTYPEIIENVKKIDVIWFNKEGFLFPQRVFEIVDTLATLTSALNRCLQLLNFQTKFLIIGPKNFRDKFLDKINREPYLKFKARFDYKDYDLVNQLYENSIRQNKIEGEFFKNSIEEYYE